MNIEAHHQQSEAVTLPVDLATEALRAFVKASHDYPASGSAQAASIALRSLELGAPPDELHRGLETLPNVYDKVAAMANNAHLHAKKDYHITPLLAEMLVGAIFDFAQEMSSQLSVAELRQIIMDHPTVRWGGPAAEGRYTNALKKRLGIEPAPDVWRRT